MSEERTILETCENGVATLRLNRPQRLNAYTVQMGVELFSAMQRLDASEDVRVIVVTGAGRAFCAGADLSSGGDTFAGERSWQAAAELERSVRPWRRRTPVVAAINGPAVGIGATLPLQWDIRVASDAAKLGFVFTRRGILPEANSTWLLPRLVGMAKATDLLLSGRLLSASEALEYGLVSRVFPHADFDRRVQELATDIAQNTAPASVALTTRLLWRQLFEQDPEAAKSREDELFYWIGKQPDAAEGVQSFLEKRAPEWKMSKRPALPKELEDSLSLPD